MIATTSSATSFLSLYAGIEGGGPTTAEEDAGIFYVLHGCDTTYHDLHGPDNRLHVLNGPDNTFHDLDFHS